MNQSTQLDPAHLLQAVSSRIPASLRDNVIVIGSIATAWAFRDVLGSRPVATKDIDLLLRPSVDAVVNAGSIGEVLLKNGWNPHFPDGVQPGDTATPADRLPALRLRPPEDEGSWFVELLAEPPPEQRERKFWRRFETDAGTFGLPSFRHMRVAIHGAEVTEWGLRAARPACMALAHLLEHAEPDRTPISGLEGQPPRFTKDVGRAVSLWWLAREQSTIASQVWARQWREALDSVASGEREAIKSEARAGLEHLRDYLFQAHKIAVAGVLDSSRTSFDAYRRAFASLHDAIGRFEVS